MKLSTLFEVRLPGQPSAPLTRKLITRIKKDIKPDITQDDIWQFCAHMEWELFYKDEPELVKFLLYEGVKPIKGDMNAPEAILEYFFDPRDPLDAEDVAIAWQDILDEFKKWVKKPKQV